MHRSRSVVIVVLLVIVILAAAGWILRSNHKTPAAQQPLADLNAQSLPNFTAEFNRSPAAVRVILLLSPT